MIAPFTYIEFGVVENLVRNVNGAGEGAATDTDDAVSLITAERIEDLR